MLAKDYVRKHGAAVLLTSLDRGAEYRADEASEVYLVDQAMAAAIGAGLPITEPSA